MKLFFLALFSLGFVGYSQNDSTKFDTDTCGYYQSWTVPDFSGLDSTIVHITYVNGPYCKKSDCTIRISPECEALEFHFTIFNRWGEVQFETTSPENGWYAYGNEDGTYIWQLEGVYLSGESFKFYGHVQIMKEIEKAK